MVVGDGYSCLREFLYICPMISKMSVTGQELLLVLIKFSSTICLKYLEIANSTMDELVTEKALKMRGIIVIKK